MPSEAVFTAPTADCPHPGRWTAPDAWATEAEVSAFLAALCVLLRPSYVVETGAYDGDTTVLLGAAVAPYGGRVDTVEIDPDRGLAVAARCLSLPVTVHIMSSAEFTPKAPVNLAFLDSALDTREAELRALHRYAAPGAIWVLHDTRQLPGVVARLTAEGVLAGSVEFPTPRGLTVGRWVR